MLDAALRKPAGSTAAKHAKAGPTCFALALNTSCACMCLQLPGESKEAISSAAKNV